MNSFFFFFSLAGGKNRPEGVYGKLSEKHSKIETLSTKKRIDEREELEEGREGGK